jgi:hypothetical protein
MGVSSMTSGAPEAFEPDDEEPPEADELDEPELLQAASVTVTTAAAARPFMNVCFIA